MRDALLEWVFAPLEGEVAIYEVYGKITFYFLQSSDGDYRVVHAEDAPDEALAKSRLSE